MPKKKKAQEEVYHVEVITKARVSEDGEWEYFVKWAGYDSDADSWEPNENVQQCERLLASFWKHIGMDEEDYPIGYEVVAEEDWINKEKRYFKETFVKPSKRRADGITKDKQGKLKSRLSTSYLSESPTEDVESQDEEPSTNASIMRNLNKKTRVADTESGSESDGHLHQTGIVPPPSKNILKISAQARRHEVSSTTSGSLTIAPPKVVAIRTHQDQKSNPLVKAMNLPSQSVGVGSSLSTKQRVAAGILPAPTGPKPLPSVPRKSSFSTLSFKKNKLPIIPTSQVKDTSVVPPESPVVQSKDIDIVASPQPMDVDQPIDIFDSNLNDIGLPGGSSNVFTASIPPKSQEDIDTENFLQSVDIPMFNNSLEIASVSEQVDLSVTELRKTLAVSKIPKRWKWSGDLFISTSMNKKELLCPVTLSDPSGTSNSSYINLLLSSLDSLRISKLYPIVDVAFLLQACGNPQYFGKLESSGLNEEEVIQGLECHLATEGLAAAIPLLLNDTEVAVLIIFSKVQQKVTKTLQVPDQLLLEASLLVVLLPFLMSFMTSINATGWRSMETVIQSSVDLQDTSMPYNLSQEIILYQAMSLLCFPKTLLDFLNSSSTIKAYGVWPFPDQSSSELDTIMLQHVLRSTKAELARPEEDVRVVFISNRYLKTLYTLPSLVAKRVNSPEVQFWTYGNSANMSYEKWRVQEIYPLGGILTFTCSALAEDPIGCHQLISQVTEHPLWECYLIPEVVATCHLIYKNKDPSSCISLLDSILNLVALGHIPVTRIPKRECSNQLVWLSKMFSYSGVSGNELLEIYLEILRSHPTTLDMTTEQLVDFTNNEVIMDLSNAQIQPIFMENYRRFVVIKASSEESIPFDKGGLEWSPLSLFSLKDDYF